MKPDGCRCEGEEHENPHCFVTPPMSPSIRERTVALGIVGNNGDLMVHALLDLTEHYKALVTVLTGTAKKLDAAADEYEKAFGNLLARIDRDGGHAQTGKTLEENLARADKRVCELLGLADELTSTLRALALSRDETHGVRAQAEKAARERDELEVRVRTIRHEVLDKFLAIAHLRSPLLGLDDLDHQQLLVELQKAAE